MNICALVVSIVLVGQVGGGNDRYTTPNDSSTTANPYGAIGADDVATELRNGLQNFALPQAPQDGARRAAIQASIRLLDAAPDRVSCPLFAAIYRAPLQKSDFSLVLTGQSGSGKSSLAALAQAHYGPVMWDRNALPADWSSTANSLEFMAFQGAEMMVQIARFWASIAKFDKARNRFEIRGVMGPDEYHDGYPDADEPGLHNNAYTNVMVAWLLGRTSQALELVPAFRHRPRTSTRAYQQIRAPSRTRVAMQPGPRRLAGLGFAIGQRLTGRERQKPQR